MSKIMGAVRARAEITDPNAERELSPPEKAALIITALGPEGAEPLLTRLNEDEVRAFARAASTLGEVPRETVDRVVDEFISGLGEPNVAMSADRLKEILGGVLSPDAIERLLEDLDETDGMSIWEKLSNSDPVDLSNYLAREHPQTVAVVVSRIRPDAGARVLARLEPDFAEEVVMRLSKVSLLSAQVMESIRSSIEDDFLRNARMKKSKRKPDELIGSIFNFLPGDRRDELLNGIGEKSPALATAVQRKMFTFKDIPTRVNRASVSVILRAVEKDVLLVALAAASKLAPETNEFLLGNMSRRLAEQYQDELGMLQPPSSRDGEEAMFAVISAIRKLAETGEISLNEPEEEGVDDSNY